MDQKDIHQLQNSGHLGEEMREQDQGRDRKRGKGWGKRREEISVMFHSFYVHKISE